MKSLITSCVFLSLVSGAACAAPQLGDLDNLGAMVHQPTSAAHQHMKAMGFEQDEGEETFFRHTDHSNPLMRDVVVLLTLGGKTVKCVRVSSVQSMPYQKCVSMRAELSNDSRTKDGNLRMSCAENNVANMYRVFN